MPLSVGASTASKTKRTSAPLHAAFMRSRSKVRYITFSAEHATTTRGVLSSSEASVRHAAEQSRLHFHLCNADTAAAATRSSQGARSSSVSARPLAMAAALARVSTRTTQVQTSSVQALTFRGRRVLVVGIQEACAQLCCNLAPDSAAQRSVSDERHATRGGGASHVLPLPETPQRTMHSASVDVAQRQRRCKHAIGADGARYGPITLARGAAARPKPVQR